MSNKKSNLSDRQHAELLLLTANNLQDIRDAKSDQRKAMISTLVMIGSIIGLWEKIEEKHQSELILAFELIVSTLTIGTLILVSQFQNKLLRFRKRQQRILDTQFELDLKPITGDAMSYQGNEKRSFSMSSDLYPLHFSILVFVCGLSLYWFRVS